MVATGGDWVGYTPCMVAAIAGRTACLRALGTAPTLDVNAVAAAGRDKGKTALDVALDHNEAEAAAFLRDELGAKRAAALTADDRRVSQETQQELLQRQQRAAAAVRPAEMATAKGPRAPADEIDV